MIKRCEICGNEYVAKRSTSRFCSSTCRSRAYRGTYFIPVASRPASNASMDTEDVLEIVSRAHGVAMDLSRASMFTPSPLCLKLKRVSQRVIDALRDEGL